MPFFIELRWWVEDAAGPCTSLPIPLLPEHGKLEIMAETEENHKITPFAVD